MGGETLRGILQGIRGRKEAGALAILAAIIVVRLGFTILVYARPELS
jgi:hypothetical protein